MWCVDFHRSGGGVFIAVQGRVTDLVKSVSCQVVAGRPWGPASIDFWLQIPFYRLLKSITVKPTHARLQSGASWPNQPGGLVDRPPASPHVNDICTLPPRVMYIHGVALILVEFQIYM
jgi:hypothetical protein